MTRLITLLLLLVLVSPSWGEVLTEGIMLPPTQTIHTLPKLEAQSYRGPVGMSKWSFLSALAAQGAACLAQEWGYKHVADRMEGLGFKVPTQGWTRLRNCAIYVGPVVGMKLAAEHWQWPRADADGGVIPLAPWGAYYTIKNLRDVRKLDRLIDRLEGR